MRKYLGIVSILILIATFFILQTLTGKYIGHLWLWIIAIGYISAAAASWFSTSGFWRKASAAILILLPVGYIAIIVLFMIGLANGSGF
ncbi:hypothetical protein [Falsibacillus albus]|uniref:DUF805 domain-containing protein n=1 Tax=Falsibacillus albus TaxID=2478915 RepID=A0A3L7JW73_9BACI|nr:hypothetical protein [Falsibacillus albus]RLQ94504.1 hypothetical protein D9X91_13245 [Falsibacillus albus]